MGLFEVLAVIGAFGGLATFYYIYTIIQEYKGSINLHSNYGVYGVNQLSGVKTQEIKITFWFNVYNSKNRKIAITDIVGFLRYKERPTNNDVFYKKPINFAEIIPINIYSLESKTIKCDFIFKSIYLNKINRFEVAHLSGFMEGDVPVYIVNELEKEVNWDNLPLEFFVNFQIDGNKELNYRFAILINDINNIEFANGTFRPLDVEKYKHKLLN